MDDQTGNLEVQAWNQSKIVYVLVLPSTTNIDPLQHILQTKNTL